MQGLKDRSEVKHRSQESEERGDCSWVRRERGVPTQRVLSRPPQYTGECYTVFRLSPEQHNATCCLCPAQGSPL